MSGSSKGVDRYLAEYHYNFFNPLTQVREEIDIDELKPLALSMQKTHQLNPILAVRLSPDEAREYLAWINDLWRLEEEGRHKLSNHVRLPNSDNVAYIIAGHRRWEVFNLGLMSSENDGEIEAFMYPGLSPFRAIRLQLAENTYKAPDTARKYMAVDRYLRLHRKQGFDMTKAECARHLGIKPEIVTKATRFANLPKGIRDSVKDKSINLKPGHGVLLERLAEGWREKLYNKDKSKEQVRDLVEKRLIHRADKILEKGTSVSQFKEEISDTLDELERNQQTLFKPETPNPQPERVFDRETVRIAGEFRRRFESKLEYFKRRAKNDDVEVTADLEYQSGQSFTFVKYVLENFEDVLRALIRIDAEGLLPQTDLEELAETAGRVSDISLKNGKP